MFPAVGPELLAVSHVQLFLGYPEAQALDMLNWKTNKNERLTTGLHLGDEPAGKLLPDGGGGRLQHKQAVLGRAGERHGKHDALGRDAGAVAGAVAAALQELAAVLLRGAFGR